MQTSESPAPRGFPAAVSEAHTDPPVTAEPVTPLEEHPAVEEHIHLPPPTIWPVTTAFGVALAGFGLVTSLVFSIAGLAIVVYGLGNWVQELRHEPH